MKRWGIFIQLTDVGKIADYADLEDIKSRIVRGFQHIDFKIECLQINEITHRVPIERRIKCTTESPKT